MEGEGRGGKRREEKGREGKRREGGIAGESEKGRKGRNLKTKIAAALKLWSQIQKENYKYK
eukprot:757478-Hanusia_phi.AAC.3